MASTPLQLNTSNVVLTTPGTIVNQLTSIVSAENALRAQSTTGPRRQYTEYSYPILNKVTGVAVQANPEPPTSTRVDVRNNNLYQ